MGQALAPWDALGECDRGHHCFALSWAGAIRGVWPQSECWAALAQLAAGGQPHYPQPSTSPQMKMKAFLKGDLRGHLLSAQDGPGL